VFHGRRTDCSPSRCCVAAVGFDDNDVAVGQSAEAERVICRTGDVQLAPLRVAMRNGSAGGEAMTVSARRERETKVVVTEGSARAPFAGPACNTEPS